MVGHGLTTHWPDSTFHLILYFPCKGSPGKRGKEWGTMLYSKRSPAQPLGSICAVKRKAVQQAHFHPAPFFLFISFLSWHDIFLVQTVCSCAGKERLYWLYSPAWRYKHCRFQQGWKTASNLHPEASFKPTTQSVNGISCGHSCDSSSWGPSQVLPQNSVRCAHCNMEVSTILTHSVLLRVCSQHSMVFRQHWGCLG